MRHGKRSFSAFGYVRLYILRTVHIHIALAYVASFTLEFHGYGFRKKTEPFCQNRICSIRYDGHNR